MSTVEESIIEYLKSNDPHITWAKDPEFFEYLGRVPASSTMSKALLNLTLTGQLAYTRVYNPKTRRCCKVYYLSTIIMQEWYKALARLARRLALGTNYTQVDLLVRWYPYYLYYAMKYCPEEVGEYYQ